MENNVIVKEKKNRKYIISIQIWKKIEKIIYNGMLSSKMVHNCESLRGA